MFSSTEMLQASRGKIPAKLVLKNAVVLNVFTKEWLTQDVAVWDDRIIGVGRYEGREEIDLTGKYLVPGFFDAHVHIESSMLTPAAFAAEILPFGTTTILADPHELANVSGEKGIRWLLDEIKRLPLNGYVMLPSCVPATELDDSGARLEAEDLLPLREDPSVLGLGEFMNVSGVCAGEEKALAKLRAFQDRVIDGHAPGLLGKDLQAYLLAGVSTDHECSEPEEALEQLRSGMNLMIRRGSGAKNGETLISTLLDSRVSAERVCFCTDDKHVEDIRREGHISSNIREAIHLGMDPAEAYAMASFNAARLYGLSHLGAIGSGYQADLVVLDDLEEVSVDSVYWKGKLVSRKGERPAVGKRTVPGFLLDTVQLQPVRREQLRLSCPDGAAHVAQVIPHQILTRHRVCQVPCTAGEFQPDRRFQKVAVVERHRGTGRVGIGVVEGFFLHGAIASTVAHDSHNLIAVGDNDQDMLLGIQALEKAGGGYCLARDGKLLEVLPLPVCGLLTQEPTEQVERALANMKKLCVEMGMPEELDPFQTLSFLSLPVLPEIRITDRGVFDSVEYRYL